MSRAKKIHDAVTKGLDKHYRVLDDERTQLKSVRVVVRMSADGKTPDCVWVSPEFEEKVL